MQNEARERQAQMITRIIEQYPFFSREQLEEEFGYWDIEEYQLLIDSGLLDPLITAREGDDARTRIQKIEDSLKELRMWRKFRKSI